MKKLTIKEILDETQHRPWKLPESNWQYYQEWNNAVFLHWKVDYSTLRKSVPDEMEIDLFEGSPWVSLVAFTMNNIRPKNLPAVPLISNFDEINIRTYVRQQNKAGVYFLSIEAGTKIACRLARFLSALPYRHSSMTRENQTFRSSNEHFSDKLSLEFEKGNILNEKTKLDKWLTERYALFQHSLKAISMFEIQHIEWPLYKIQLKELTFDYPRFENLLNQKPALMHYSPGVQVIAWGKENFEIIPETAPR